MPNIKSAKKRVLVNDERHDRNQAAKSELKTAIKRVETAVAAGDKALAESEFKSASKCIDQAAASGLIAKNTAGRRKSRLQKLVNTLEA